MYVILQGFSWMNILESYQYWPWPLGFNQPRNHWNHSLCIEMAEYLASAAFESNDEVVLSLSLYNMFHEVQKITHLTMRHFETNILNMNGNNPTRVIPDPGQVRLSRCLISSPFLLFRICEGQLWSWTGRSTAVHAVCHCSLQSRFVSLSWELASGKQAEAGRKNLGPSHAFTILHTIS